MLNSFEIDLLLWGTTAGEIWSIWGRVFSWRCPDLVKIVKFGQIHDFGGKCQFSRHFQTKLVSKPAVY